MGMECVNATAFKYWPTGNYAPGRWLEDADTATTTTSASSPPLGVQSPPSSLELDWAPHSAPSSCTLLSSACRRAAAHLPVAHRAHSQGDLQFQIRESELSPLNGVPVKVPRTLLQELRFYNQRQLEAQQWAGPSRPGGIKMYSPTHDEGCGSESDTEEGRVSSTASSTPSSSAASSDDDDTTTVTPPPPPTTTCAAAGGLNPPALLLNDQHLQLQPDLAKGQLQAQKAEKMAEEDLVDDGLADDADDLNEAEDAEEDDEEEEALQEDIDTWPQTTLGAAAIADAIVSQQDPANQLTIPDKSLDDSTGSSSSSSFQLTHEDTASSAPDSTDSAPCSRSASPHSRRKPHHHKLPKGRSARRGVRFADECGNELYQLKVLTEPSDYPPAIPRAVLQRHRKAAGLSDLSDEEDQKAKPKSTWKVSFKQPASDYVKFRHTLEQKHVALENVIVKNDVPKLVGTIKVANRSFEKRVFLRCTADRWVSFQDHDAKFLTSASNAYDTFTFDMPIPSNIGQQQSHLEFCIGYVAGTEQHWDSNQGANFALDGVPSGPASPPRLPSPNGAAPLDPALLPAAKLRAQANDAYRMDYKQWSSFASWKALSTDSPYW